MNRREQTARTIGLNIATRRVRLRMTQADLAERSGCHRVSISYFESGDRLPDVDKMLRIAKVLRCPLVALLDGVPGVLEAAAG